MAETWLDEIYRQAYIIQELHEVVWYLNTGNSREARTVYNRTASQLEELISTIAKEDTATANYLQDRAVSVMDAWKDRNEASGKIQSELLPGLFEYMKNFTDISVEDNGYILQSADSGFLTIKSIDNDHFYHDVHDPLYESFQLAQQIYKPEMEVFRIMGAGLGYLAYALWTLSNKAMQIYVYEDESHIIEYATHYGVLSWIDESCLDIIIDPDRQKLGDRFLADVRRDKDHGGRYVTPWKGRSFAGVCDGLIIRLNLTDDSNRMLRKMSSINLWRNSKIRQISLNELQKSSRGDEWVVIAAGPSFDDNLDFIRESIGTRNTIAVNTVLRRLSNEGLRPDISVAADPYEQLYAHIADILPFTDGIPLIADKLTDWKYCEDYRGEKCFVPTAAGRFIPGAINSDDDVWEVGGTVTALAIEAAIRLGAKTVHVIGLDLAYPAGVNYAEGMSHERRTDSNVTMEVRSVEGGMVGTNEVFDLFRKSIEEQLSRHRDVTVINRSLHGAMIKGTKTIV